MGSDPVATVTSFVVEKYDRYLILYTSGPNVTAMKSGKRCECGHFESVHEDNGAGACTICKVKVTNHFARKLAPCQAFVELAPEIPEPVVSLRGAFGCKCPIPFTGTYDPACPVHLWVCQAGTCQHFDEWDKTNKTGYAHAIVHTGAHEFCDHCTSPFIVCERCEAMYIDWRVDPRVVGWRVTSIGPQAEYDSENVVSLFRDAEWVCRNCS